MTVQEREKTVCRDNEISRWKIGQHREWDWRKLLQEQIAAGLVAEESFRCPTCGTLRRNRFCLVCGSRMDLRTMTETVHGDESAK